MRCKILNFSTNLPLPIYRFFHTQAGLKPQTPAEHPFRVGVCGTFNSGKTSLINGLIGYRILPVSSAGDTLLPTELYHSFHPKIVLHLRAPLNADELQEIASVFSAGCPRFAWQIDSDTSICYHIKSPGISILQQCVESIDDSLRKHTDWVNRHLSLMEIACPFDVSVRHLHLIDLPGTGRKKHDVETIMGMPASVQHILHVLDAEHLDGKDVLDLKERCGVLDKPTTYVLNKTDLLSPADRDAALQYMGEYFAQPYFCCSAAMSDLLLRLRLEGIDMSYYLKNELRMNISELFFSELWNHRHTIMNRYLTCKYAETHSGITDLRQHLTLIG